MKVGERERAWREGRRKEGDGGMVKKVEGNIREGGGEGGKGTN